MKIERGVPWSLFSVLLAVCGCGQIEDTQQHSHGCNYHTNAVFTGFNLTLDHTDDRACTLDYEPYEQVETALTVYDNNHLWGDTVPAETIYLAVEGFEYYSYGAWMGYGTLSGDWTLEYFGWGEPREFSWEHPWEWMAYLEVTFLGGDEDVDYLECRVDVWSEVTDAIAVIEISHVAS